MDLNTFIFITLLFLVAFLYASVGHGGASGYLALMALFSIPAAFMRPSALVLNLFVAGMAFFQFWRGGYFKWRLFLPFAIASVPLAFAGAHIQLDPVWYKRILGVFLVFATLRILGLFGSKKSQETNSKVPLGWALLIGGIIGLFSGMIGIGGGIILSPIILLLGWGNIKETAAVSALFILVNSASGLIGLVTAGAEFAPMIYVWVAIALAGGWLGSYSGSLRFRPVLVRNILAGILILASIKLLFV